MLTEAVDHKFVGVESLELSINDASLHQTSEQFSKLFFILKSGA
jgi:hypothetical protein